MKMNSQVLVFIVLMAAASVFAQDAGKAAEIYNQGLQLQERGDLANALLAYDKAVSLNPKFADAYNNRANIKLSRGDIDGALADLSAVIAIDPKHPLSYYNRGNIYLQKGGNDEAIADFTKAIEILSAGTRDYDWEAHAMSYNNRGNALQAKGDAKAALADYNSALKIKPTTHEALVNRGAAKHVLEDYAGAIEDYTKALEARPKSILIYLNRASSYEETDKNAAIADYTTVITLDPKQAEAHARRGVLLIDLGRKAEGIQDLQTAFRLEPGLKPDYERFLKEALKK